MSMEFTLLINVGMPTIVRILTFINRMNTPCMCLKVKNKLFFSIYIFMRSCFSCSVELCIIVINIYYNEHDFVLADKCSNANNYFNI